MIDPLNDNSTPGQVSVKTVHASVAAISAVALAAFLGALLHILQYLLSLHRSGVGIFHFATLVSIFWIAATSVLVIAGVSLLAYLIHQGSRDAAVAAAGFCLALVALNIVPFLRSLADFAGSAASIVLALQTILLLVIPAAALALLLFLLHRWPARSSSPTP